MNKIILLAVLVGGTLLLGAPVEAAHKSFRMQYPAAARHDTHYYAQNRHYRRSHHRHGYRRGDHFYSGQYRHHRNVRRAHMPNWLRHQGTFRDWYRRTPRRHDRYLTWHQLFDIYRWEYSRDYRYHHYRH